MVTVNTCKTQDFEMDYIKFGTGDKTFVIIPGLSVQSVMGAAEAVAEEYRVMDAEFTTYLLDRRKEVPDKYTVHDMAEDTVKVLQELGLKDIYMFGASQGGMIAMDIAINHPNMIKKLVLGSTSSRVHPKQLNIIEEWIGYAKAGDRQSLYLSFGEKLYPAETFEQYRDYFIETSKTVTDAELKKFIILAESIRDYDLRDRVKEIKCPTLAIGAYDDNVLDSDAIMEIAQNLDFRSDFKLFMYGKYGHAAYDTAPDYRDRIYKFMIGENNV